MIYPNNFESKIRFDRIRELLQNRCLSSLGKELVDEIEFSNNFSQVERLVNQVDEFKQICQGEDNFPIGYFIDVRRSLEKARVEGTYMEVEEVFDLKRSLESISAILRFFASQEEGKYPYLSQLTGDVKMYPFLFEKINSILTKNGRIKDNASANLQQIRRQLIQKQSGISRRMQVLMREAQREGWVEKDVSLSMRDGRMVIPVSSAYKRKIKGIVHDESSTGKTSFIEPGEIVETNNEIRELGYAERREITRILHDFTSHLRPYIPDLFQAYEFLALMDFIRAKALFAIEVGGVLPQIQDTPALLWESAVHPLLFLSLSKEGRSVVPLNMEMDQKQRIILISGPNAGGKSVCLQTVGLLQYMFQCGLLVPIEEKSKMGIFHRIFIDMGDEQSIENDLSTYSSHLMNMKFFLKNSNAQTMVLIDEFGTGTEPMLGGAIAESILDKLNQKQVRGVITTHYTNLKHFSSEADGIENGAMLYDSHLMQPLFKLQIGKPGSSFAFEIARKIGLPEDILEDATEKVGKDHINFDKHLRDIVRDKRYWEKKREKIRYNEKKLDQLVQRYDGELKEASKLRKEILGKAKEEAQQMLSGANRVIEKTIRDIKESNAQKEKTRKARKEFEQAKEEITYKDTPEEERINRKMQKLKERQERGKKHSEDPSTASLKVKPTTTPKVKDDKSIQKGDMVKLDQQSTYGEVIEINDKTAVVAFGNLLTSVKVKRLTKVSRSKIKKDDRGYNQTSALIQERISKRRLSFKADLDVRGERGDEALQIVMDHVDEAIMLEVREFRILHGTGHGILRQLIRDYLSTVHVVKSFRDEKVQLGGSGITVVTME